MHFLCGLEPRLRDQRGRAARRDLARRWLGFDVWVRGRSHQPAAPTATMMRSRMLPNCSAVIRDGVGLTRRSDTLVT